MALLVIYITPNFSKEGIIELVYLNELNPCFNIKIYVSFQVSI